MFGSKQSDQDQVDVLFLELVVGPRFRVLSEGSADTLVRPFVLGSAVHLGDDALYASFGGGVEVSRQVNDGSA